MIAFEEKISEQDALKVQSIAAQLQTNPDWIMAVINAETIGTFDPSVQNTTYPLYNGPATGIFQFTPDTAISLGTTIDKLKGMTFSQQLDYVYKLLHPYIGKLNSYFDVYMAVFFPAAIGKPDDWIIETKKISRTSVARQNPSIDMNKNGMITVAEFKEYLYNTIPAKLRNLIFDVWQKKN